MKMKITTTLSILAISLLMIFTGSCRKLYKIDGNGHIETETRNLVSFNKVDNEGTFNVFIKHDSLFTATIEAESNLIPYVRTIVNGNTLQIDTRENLHEHYPINVYITTPILHGVYLSGSGFVKLDSIDSESLEIALSGSGRMSGYVNTGSLVTKISGSGSIDLESYTNSCDVRISGSGSMDLYGESGTGSFSISGSGDIRSYNYQQIECISKISGSGSMYLNVVDYLDVTISGSGNVFYIGDPSLNVRITGSGQVIKQ